MPAVGSQVQARRLYIHTDNCEQRLGERAELGEMHSQGTVAILQQVGVCKLASLMVQCTYAAVASISKHIPNHRDHQSSIAYKVQMCGH